MANRFLQITFISARHKQFLAVIADNAVIGILVVTIKHILVKKAQVVLLIVRVGELLDRACFAIFVLFQNALSRKEIQRSVSETRRIYSAVNKYGILFRFAAVTAKPAAFVNEVYVSFITVYE